MVRSYKRKTDRGKIENDVMKKAVEEVNGGKAIRQVAKEFTIPYPTLRRYVVLQKNRPNNNSITRFTPHYDNHKVFTTDQEKELVNYLLTCSKMCFALDTKTCRRLAYELASKNNLSFPDNWNLFLNGRYRLVLSIYEEKPIIKY